MYDERTSGLCTDGGGGYIGTQENCEEGAGVFGWSDTTVSNKKRLPRGYPQSVIMLTLPDFGLRF